MDWESEHEGDEDENVTNLYDIVTKDLSGIENLDDFQIYQIVSTTYYWADYDFITKIRWLFNLVNQEETNIKDLIINKDFSYEFVTLFYEIIDIIVIKEPFLFMYPPVDTIRKDTIFRSVSELMEMNDIVYKYDFYFESKLVTELDIEDISGDSIDIAKLLPFGKLIVPITDNNMKIVNLKDATQAILTAHTDWIVDIAVIQTGLVTCSLNGELILFNLEDNTVLYLQYRDDVRISKLLSLGDKFVSGSDTGETKVWDLNGDVIATLSTDHNITVLKKVSRNKIVIGNDDGQILIWDYGLLQFTELQGHTRSIKDILITPDQTRLISSSWDNSIKIWDLKREIFVTTITTNYVTSLTFTSDRKHFIGQTSDTHTHVWDLEGNVTRTLYTRFGQLSSIINLPDGRIAIAYGDNSDNQYMLKIWNKEIDVPDIVIQLGGIPKLFLQEDGAIVCIMDTGTVNIFK